MGLDMYLRASRYVGGWDHSKDDLFDPLVELVGLKPCTDSPGVYVEVTVGYWRKANAIHAWFVDWAQDGEDNCRPYYVSREQLAELRRLCKLVLNAEPTTGPPQEARSQGPATSAPATRLEVAQEYLPTQAGFFFGSTDYDEWYEADLQRTVEIIDDALALPPAWEFEYQSSW